MSEPGRGAEANQVPGWGDLASLEIKPKEERFPVKFNLGTLVWLWVLLCALGSAWFAWRSRGSGASPEMLGYYSGSFLGACLLAYAIGWIMFRVAGRNLAAGRITACVIAALSLTGSVSRGVEHSQLSKLQQDALLQDIRGSVAQMAKGGDASGRIATLESTANVGGEPGEIQAFMKSYFNRMISQQNEYLVALEAIGWDKLLDPERISKDSDLAASRATLARGKQTVAQFRQRWIQTYNEAQTAVQAMGASSPMKRGFARGFNESSDVAYKEAMKVWDLEAEIVDTASDLVTLLSSKRDAWTVESGQFVFSDEQALSEFNVYARKIDELVRREDEIRNANLARTELVLRKLEPR